MNLLIFGATGGTGIQLVEQALKLDHTVTAFAKTPARLQLTNPRLQTIQGDVLNLSSVEYAMQNQDAVLSSIGSPANKIGTIRSTGTKNIITAMEKAGIRRFICQTSLGMAIAAKHWIKHLFTSNILLFLLFYERVLPIMRYRKVILRAAGSTG